jgi:hypothetical protein
MNSDGLAKLYDGLTPRERVPLMVAASCRGDAAEAQRLSRSAPKQTMVVPDYHGWSEGLFALSAFHLQTLGVLGVVPRFVKKKTDAKRRSEGLLNVIRILAYRIVVESDAWKLFCAGLNIDPEALLRDQPSYDLIWRMEKTARAEAFTPEEALTHVRRAAMVPEGSRGPAGATECEYCLTTAEDRAQEMQEFLEERVASWS